MDTSVNKNKMEKLSVDDVVEVIKRNGWCEFENIVRDKKLDGKVLMVNIDFIYYRDGTLLNYIVDLAATDGSFKRWQIKANGKQFINFIKDFKCNPDKFIANKSDNSIDIKAEAGKTMVNIKHNQTITVETNGNRVSVTKVSEENFVTSSTNIEEIIYKITPPKSFLYRNKKTKKLKTPENKTAYVPMNVVKPTNRQGSKLFRLSSYEYPFFDLSKFKYFTSTARNERSQAFNDRGYYCMKNQQSNQQDIYRTPAPKLRRKSLSNADDIDVCFEDHFYEDLCYEPTKEVNDSNRNSARTPYIVRVQELFQSIKISRFFKHQSKDNTTTEEEGPSCSDMYDSVLVNTALNLHRVEKKEAKVEEYLEPINNIADYCDVVYKQKDESFVGIILKMFENKFGNKKEPTDDAEKSISEDGSSNFAEIQKKDSPSTSYMADRPLPVPLENENYFMEIDRVEAFQLLQGHEDGTFLLRPSSQPNHAYTLSICCSGTIQNVGVRRREDGRLSLGYARKGERSFTNIPSLLRYHRKKKLLLVAGGTNLGSTTLKEPPMYYQVPTNIPVQKT